MSHLRAHSGCHVEGAYQGWSVVVLRGSRMHDVRAADPTLALTHPIGAPVSLERVLVLVVLIVLVVWLASRVL